VILPAEPTERAVNWYKDMHAPRTHTDLSLARSALWLMVAKTAAFALSIAVPLLLVRHLTVREFGVYKQVFLLLDTATVILPLGFAMSAFYFFAREPTRKAQIVGNILLVHALMGGLGGLIVMAFPGLLATVLNSRDLAAYAVPIGIAMLLAVGSSSLEYIAVANGEAKVAALIITGMQLLRGTLLVSSGVLLGSVRALAYAAAVAACLQSAVMVWYVGSRFLDTRWSVDWSVLRAQLRYALPLTYVGLLWWLQTSVHNYFASNHYGAAAYAVYAVGCFQLPIVGILLESVGSVVIRRVSELRTRNETREILRLLASTVRSLAAVVLPMYALLLVAGREFITVLFTARYRESWPIFAVNLTLIPLSIVAPACDAVFRAYPEHLPFLLKVRTVLLVPLLGGLWIATERLGLVGVIAVVVGVNVVERVAGAIKVARILSITWRDLGQFKDVAKLSGAAGVAGFTAAIIRPILLANGLAVAPLLAICAGVFACVYLGAVLVLRVSTAREREAIRHWLVPVTLGRAAGQRD